MQAINEHTRLAFYQMVAKVSARFVAAKVDDIDSSIQQALADIGSFFRADRSYIFEFSDYLEFADNTYEWCADGVPAEIDNLKDLPMDMYQDWIGDWQAGRSIPIADIQSLDPNSPERLLLEPQGMRALLMVPLPSDDGIQGIFGIDLMHEPYDWQEEQITLLQIVGEIMSSALQRKRADQSFRLRQLISRIAVEFINLPTKKVDITVTKALARIQSFLDLSNIHIEKPLAPEFHSTKRALLKKLQKQPVLTDSSELGLDLPHELPALGVLLRHGENELGTLIATQTSRRVLEHSETVESLQLIADLVAGTLARKATEQKVEYLAYYDELTALPNRRLITNRLEHSLSIHRGYTHACALLFVDLDNFKRINDSRGREAGDELLQQVTGRLLAAVSEEDTLARVGGDQFLLLIETAMDNNEQSVLYVQESAERIRAELARPFRINGHTFHGSASIGIVYGNNQETPANLLKQAELAMYKAKAQGRNTIQYYDPAMQQEAIERAQLYSDLRTAIADKQFEVYYQAQNNADDQIIGAEALVRWHHPTRGLLSPGQFIAFAEETGLIGEIGKIVLKETCHLLNELKETGYDIPISVNISAEHILQPEFLGDIRDILTETGANPERLKLEITESAMIRDTDTVVEHMLDLQKLGVRFSLDDFGTGYSSLSYLKALPIHEIKLDLRFVRDMVKNTDDTAIADLVFRLAKVMNLDVIAEGVAEPEQKDFLLELGCQRFQGFLFSHPLPVPEFRQFLASAQVIH
ncbi:putative bifunctional diguanylate cyclase/phosphodiesterase [Aliidiomarina indica]|uniref:putative bifunctional diguanylate cyclase/phosphodiesterase n=1 Tax=Aliidiomarina indica TaxID=2749147 RepID=UPI001890A988|nr:EAL domain-containing protein [Aliidiomarina indica]